MNEPCLTLAHWCWHPQYRLGECGYMLFRRTVESDRETAYDLALSADSRYVFYLDDVLLGRGPCRGDMEHYHYETYRGTLAPGKHVFAIEVVTLYNGFRPQEGVWSEVHWGGGFFAAGHAGAADLSTPTGWLCMADRSRRLRLWSEAWDDASVMPAPPPEEADFSLFPVGWRSVTYDDSFWQPPVSAGLAHVKGECLIDPLSQWALVPRAIPQMAEIPYPVQAILRAENVRAELVEGKVVAGFEPGKSRLLLDLGKNRTSIFKLVAKGGAGTLRMAVAERLLVDGKKTRFADPAGEIGGSGYADLLKFAGEGGEFEPFWYRAGRFVELTGDLTQPLALEFAACDFHYPFELKTTFECTGFAELKDIFEVSWNTALGCAHEHYEDCPYYEQLQYAGDTLIQALISYALTGDGRLGKQALRQFNVSRSAAGLTQSRYPNTMAQYIPAFSLYWVLMIEDYFEYFGDLALVDELRRGVHAVMDYFEDRRQSDGLIGNPGEWGFTDWANDWPGGCIARGSNLPDGVTNFIYAECCQAAARLYPAEEAMWQDRRQRTLAAARQILFDPASGRYRDLPGKEFYSFHTNLWALLAGAEADESALLAWLLNLPEAQKGTLFFRFYLLELLRQKRLTKELENELANWLRPLELGFTTFPETPYEYSRSDCHAWSASPAYEIVRTYFGVSPCRGFAAVRVAPQPGRLTSFKGTVPAGEGRLLQVAWTNTDDEFELKLSANIVTRVCVELPSGSQLETVLAPDVPWECREERGQSLRQSSQKGIATV